MGIHSVLLSCVVQDLKGGFEAVVPFAAVDLGLGDDWCEVKFRRSEDVSSVFDFSKIGRRITDGPPDIMFLALLAWKGCWRGGCIRGRENELHDGGWGLEEPDSVEADQSLQFGIVGENE